MKNPGPFGKAFAITTVLFLLNLVVASSTGNQGLSSDNIGQQVAAHHIMAALAAGAMGKLALKQTKWLTILSVYIPVCAIFIGLGIH